MSDDQLNQPPGSNPRATESWQVSERFRELLFRGETPDQSQMAGNDPDLVADLDLIRNLYDIGRDLGLEAEGSDEWPVTRPLNGRYVLTRKLGAGGMGVVYEAEDVELERRVAVKLLRDASSGDENDLRRFQGEAKLQAHLNHPHVVTLHDVGRRDDGALFLVMELVEGGSAQAFIDGDRPRDRHRVTEIIRDACRGLVAVHGAGLLHRDIKPGNILLTSAGIAKLSDFGLAKLSAPVNPNLTASNEVRGTLLYMSPEQLAGRFDQRSDIYSLGASFYAMLTGRLTDPGGKRDFNHISPRYATVIRRSTDPDPAQRYQSAGEMLGALEALQRRPRRWDILIAATAAILLAAVGGWLVTTAPVWRVFSHLALGTGTTPAEPLRVRLLEVFHLKGIGDKQTEPRGVFGKETFGASLEDSIKVTATLSRPAYCYLIVFRPDGIDDILFPESDNAVPKRTEDLRYPMKERTEEYGLNDGTGLWLVALVASDTELPAYKDWRIKHPGSPWRRSEGKADLVWLDDGDWIEAMTPRESNRASRGKKKATGAVSLVEQLVDWLKAETGGTVSAVGFTVEKTH